MRILIVDDEARHRRGMLNLMRTIRPEYRVSVANNGMEALQSVKEWQPDLVLTDIRMPNMDGLAFLEKLGEVRHRPKVVFLSAYNLFEYAQTALRHGAYDYLLKPVDTDKVEAVLRRIEEQASSEENADTAGASLPHTLVADWLSGRSAPPGCVDAGIPEWGDGPGRLVVSEYEPLEGVPASEDAQALCRDLERRWAAFGEARSFIAEEPGSRRLRAVTLLGGTGLDGDDPAYVRDMLERMADDRAHAQGRLVHAIGSPCANLLAEGPRLYRACLDLLPYSFYDDRQGIVFQEERSSSPSATLELDPERLFSAVIGQQADKAAELCRTAFVKLSGNGWTAPSVVKDNASLTVMNLKSRFRSLLEPGISARLTETAVREIPESESFFALLALLEARLLELAGYLQNMKRGRSEYAIESCIELIESRYAEDLALEQVAERYRFNPSYFSTLFKNHTGKSFSDYVTDTRIEKAKKWLADRQNVLKIYDIAERCGYRDTKYFHRIFKKRVGVSPEAYRHKAWGGSEP